MSDFDDMDFGVHRPMPDTPDVDALVARLVAITLPTGDKFTIIEALADLARKATAALAAVE